MKRFWIGFSILLVLLMTGVVVTLAIRAIHDPIARDLQAAGEAAMVEKWDKAAALAAGAQTRWKKWHSLTAAFADHTPMDKLDSLFAELSVYAAAADATHFAATCANLSQLAQAMADSHTPTWWNFL